jgi:hypothetical protein
MLDETRRSRGYLSYSIKGELFGQDYGPQLPYHLIFCSHVLLSWIIRNKIGGQWRRGGISVAPPDQKVYFYFLIFWSEVGTKLQIKSHKLRLPIKNFVFCKLQIYNCQKWHNLTPNMISKLVIKYIRTFWPARLSAPKRRARRAPVSYEPPARAQ